MDAFSTESLVGMAISDEQDAMRALAYEEDGWMDCHEADHQEDRCSDLGRSVADLCDVLSVFAEESLRFSR